jgi:hypothetical protein
METNNSIEKIYPRPRRESAVLPVLLLVLLFFSACNQDAIFFNISQEVERREPQIKGTPTNMVILGDYLYVANFVSVYRYGGGNENPVWGSLPHPGGQIWGLAATKNVLYVLTDGGLKYFDGTDWKAITLADNAQSYSTLHRIYADSERLFVGSRGPYPAADSKNYAILYLGTSGTLKLLKSDVALLSGAVYVGTTHFVSTTGSGIFTVTGSPPAITGPISNDEREITGIINLEDAANTIVAVDRGGTLLAVNTTSLTEKGNVGRSTGGLAIWRQDNNQRPRLLLTGYQGSITSTSQTYIDGYREIVLDYPTGSLPDSSSYNIPGDDGNPISSISNRAKYESSLGIIPVNYLFQVPYAIDQKMILFAATQGEGLWSYRDHGDGDVNWNVE